MEIKFHPSTYQLVEPIIGQITNIYIKQSTYPMIGPNNEPEQDKLVKQLCVHYVFDGSQTDANQMHLVSMLDRNEKGELYCKACGRKISTQFNEESIDILMKAIEEINKIIYFGPINGLKTECVKELLDLKRGLPIAAQLSKTLNEFVKRDDSNAQSVNGLANEYKPRQIAFTRTV